MEKSFIKMLNGYDTFRKKYALGDVSVMQHLSEVGQAPETMFVACCDSRVDPAVILQCDPGDVFVMRNVANIVPPYKKDGAYHETSAALEFGIRSLKVKHLILLGHTQCGGIRALLKNEPMQNDFITTWVSVLNKNQFDSKDPDECAKLALNQSKQNCLTFPWMNASLSAGTLRIHLWFFNIEKGQVFTYSDTHQAYQPLDSFLKSNKE